MSKQVLVEVHGLISMGNSKAEAKAEANARIDSILADMQPSVLIHGGSIAVISRVASGIGGTWGYELVRPGDAPVKHLSPMSSYTSRQTCLSFAAFHLAQNEGHFVGLESLLSEAKQAELTTYFEHQRRYAEAKAQGHTDSEARTLAFA